MKWSFIETIGFKSVDRRVRLPNFGMILPRLKTKKTLNIITQMLAGVLIWKLSRSVDSFIKRRSCAPVSCSLRDFPCYGGLWAREPLRAVSRNQAAAEAPHNRPVSLPSKFERLFRLSFFKLLSLSPTKVFAMWHIIVVVCSDGVLLHAH